MRKKVIPALVLLSLMLTGCASPAPQAGAYRQVTMQEAVEMMEAEEEGYIILDVRTEQEFASGHIPGAVLLPKYSYGLRTELDDRSETVGYKIRSAQLEKVPYMIVIGDKEAESGVVSVRRRGEGVIGEMSLDDFIARLQKEIAEKRLD